jgi:sulfite oxidase
MAQGQAQGQTAGAPKGPQYLNFPGNVSIDFGASWSPAQLTLPRNPYDWQRWTASVKLPSEGYFEVWTRATDSRGLMQPHVAGSWNPQGYGGNPMHRVAIRVA